MRPYTTLAVVLAMQYFFIFTNWSVLQSKHLVSIREWLYSCPMPCTSKEECQHVHRSRGKNYGYDPTGNTHDFSTCMLTGWEISHFMLHVFLGLFYNIYVSQALSIGFEVYEHHVLGCGSYNDLVINLAGFLVGQRLRQQLNP